MQDVFGITCYTPAVDEPSLWSVVPGEVSTEWLLWHSFKKRVGIIKAHGIGKDLLAGLESNQIRGEVPLDQKEPPLVAHNAQFRQAGITHTTLSLTWVLWTHYRTGVSLSDAHALGMNMIHSGSKPIVTPEDHPMLG